MQFRDTKLLMFDDFTIWFVECDTHRNMIRFLPEYDKYIRRIRHAFYNSNFVDALIRREREYDELKEQVATLTSSEQQLKEQVAKMNATLDTILQTLLKDRAH
ncbi:MAG: PhzA/PhzB family protein [Paludibacteraceae bacterium]|nr:PhzA/PhzB family protein [Paludibacteraceae bacterium]